MRVFLIFLMVPFLMIVCAKEEATKPLLDSFIGEWQALTYTAAGAGNWEYTHTLTFDADDTFTYHRVGKFEEQRVHYNASGTYEVAGGVLTLNYTEPSETVATYSYEFTTESVILSSTTLTGDVKEYELQP
ncbi:lipocalin family protein [candidate division KSB1 bacterium]